MSNELVVAGPTVADVMTMADVIVKSGLFPAFRNRESAAAMMLLCRAKGLDPMTAVERNHIVQGRPVMRADAMLGEFVRMGGSVKWGQRDDKAAEATFSHPQGGTVTVRWTIEQAKAAKLTGKDVWTQYPRQMLHARCVSEGVRSVLPGATNGLYTPEEAYNMEPVVAEPVRASSRDSDPIVDAVVVEDKPKAIRARKSKPEPEPEPIEIAPAAMDKIETRKAVIVLMQDFAEAAKAHGIDIEGVNGKPSRSKLCAEAGKLWAGVEPFDCDNPEHWSAVHDRLMEIDQEPAGDELVLEAEVVTKNADTSDLDPDIEDPFAEI